MFLESIGYTAILIKYVARQTGRSISDITSTLGLTQVFNLCHNAPMNRLLPIERIAREVLVTTIYPLLAGLTALWRIKNTASRSQN